MALSNDAGALLVDAASDFIFEYVRATNWDPMGMPAALLPKDYLPKPDDPLFAAQVTRLACGLVALGVVMNHNVGDGHSFLPWLTRGAGLPPPLFLRASIQGITRSRIRSFLNWIERVPDKTTIQPGFEIFLGRYQLV
ncbi:hypothetical protein BC937DRAFT_89266 [Endogone sp. FLAS-F59071]|nr:hypothetical protein BC937DRAFT_89266 [Endogone sp. FLAS-F59071]|eukprot:RUS17987.1 hypothetical protein BC937DRAFT_89266 [Endogone sp. FLAS-F59071]